MKMVDFWFVRHGHEGSFVFKENKENVQENEYGKLRRSLTKFVNRYDRSGNIKRSLEHSPPTTPRQIKIQIRSLIATFR